MDQSEFTGMNDDEMLAAVLEMSRHDAGPNIDEPSSSPDTGFGDTDAQELTQHLEPLEGDKASGGIEHVRLHCPSDLVFCMCKYPVLKLYVVIILAPYS